MSDYYVYIRKGALSYWFSMFLEYSKDDWKLYMYLYYNTQYMKIQCLMITA